MMHKMAFITRLLIKFSLLAVCLSWACATQAESMRATRAEAVVGSQGQFNVSSRFNTTLPSALQDALKQGVTLNFELNYQLVAPKLLAYNVRFNPLVDTVKPVIYKLSYHPLTDKYRVTVGTFSTEYSQLDTALRAVGSIANWQVHPKSTFGRNDAGQIQANVRLNLSSNQLPKPFQVNTITSKNWNLDSGWVRLRARAG